MIYIVRHGTRADGQYLNEKLNILDNPLSEKGFWDAENLARYFMDINLKKIYASEYIRTQQTAAPTAQQKGLPVIIDSRLNEINNGDLKDMPDSEVAKRYPLLWNDFINHTRDVRFPNGESGEDVKQRQDSFLAEIKPELGDIAVFTHDGYIRLLMCNLLGLPVHTRYKFRTHMGGVSLIDYLQHEDEWQIVRYNLPCRTI